MNVTRKEILEVFADAQELGARRQKLTIAREDFSGRVLSLTKRSGLTHAVVVSEGERLCLSPNSASHYAPIAAFSNPKRASCDACASRDAERARRLRETRKREEMMGWVSGVVTRIDAERNIMAISCTDGTTTAIVGTRSFVVGSRVMIRKVNLATGTGNIDTWEVIGVPDKS